MTHRYLLLFTLLMNSHGNCEKVCKDRTPLGMRNGLIKTSQLNVSSSYSGDYEKSQGRLNIERAWCSSVKVNDPFEEYFQVNFEKITIINGIAIQGDPLSAENYITKFKLMYQNNDNLWKEFLNGQNFSGNTNNHDVAYNWFSKSLITLKMRLYATALKRTGAGRHPCLRMEIYGCLNHENLYPLGMETEIIKNDQLKTNSSYHWSRTYARLFNTGKGLRIWYSHQNVYLRVDLKQLLIVQAIAMQGFHSEKRSIVTKYSLQTSNDDKTYQRISSKDFIGNDILGTDPVFQILPSPVTTRYLKIQTVEFNRENNYYYYMKVELYGHHPVCDETLSDYTSSPSSSHNTSILPSDAYIDSPISWCSIKDDDVFVHLTFQRPVIISGIALQGDSNSDSWVEKYDLALKLPNYQSDDNVDVKNIIGNKNRNQPLSVTWLPKLYVINQLYIKPSDCKNDCCMRFKVFGCKKVLFPPTISLVSQVNSSLSVTWNLKHTITINEYKITINATKFYNESFFYKKVIKRDTNTFDLAIPFGAAQIIVTIQPLVTIKGYIYSNIVAKEITVFAKDPPSPQIHSVTGFNGYSKYVQITILEVEDINGPVSFYQVILSYEKFTAGTMDGMTLLNQQDALRQGLSYFLIKKGSSSDFVNGMYELPRIVEGEENIKGLETKLPNIGKFYMYVRAVISSEDIKPYGFGNKSYIGFPSEYVLVRESLKKPALLKNVQKVGKVAVNLIKGPNDTDFYQVIVMKSNDTTHLQPTTMYNDTVLKSYEDAAINEPYVTAIFHASKFSELENFIIGDGKTYQLSEESRQRRSVGGKYINGKLVPGQYMYFQRTYNKSGYSYSSPWSNEFTVVDGKEPSSSPSIPLIIGIVVGFLLLIVIAGCVYFKRFRKAGHKKKDRLFRMSELTSSGVERTSAIENDNVISMESTNENSSEGVEYESYYNLNIKPKNSPVPVNEFPSYYLKHKDKDNSDFQKQFGSVPLHQIHSCDVAAENKSKNRYQNIMAYDHSRVKLQGERSDYINANYIKGYVGDATYIATQGPKSKTIFDFWRMILQEKPSVIIMLTNLIENGKQKSEQYWPEKRTGSYDGITVKVSKTEEFADYAIRSIEVRYGVINHSLLHLHFTSWPDKGCPEYPTMLLNFCYRFRNLVPYDVKSLVVVHCSAGVGRTGAFIVIDAMMDLIQRRNIVDIFNYFEAIRQDRYQMIQTVEQYLFVYHVIYEFISCGNTGISALNLDKTLLSLLNQVDGNGRFRMDLEFERLNNVTPDLSVEYFQKGMLLENASKNRSSNILPRDNRLIEGTEYLNAIYVDGYRMRDGYVATEAPSVDTMSCFWSAVVQCKVTTLVMLYITEECSSLYPIFWPNNDVLRFESCSVRFMEETEIGDLVHRKFLISVKKITRKLNLLQIRNWPDHDILNPTSMLTLINEVLKSQQSLGNGKIMITCSDGANRSGTFIACMNTLEQLKAEQHIDVFQVVRRIRLIRPQFVENLRQYQFIYEVAAKYLDSFSTYSNFT